MRRPLIDSEERLFKRNTLVSGNNFIAGISRLGYLPEDAKQYSDMRDRIQKIELEVKGENKVTAMYGDLKGALAKWLPW